MGEKGNGGDDGFEVSRGDSAKRENAFSKQAVRMRMQGFTDQGECPGRPGPNPPFRFPIIPLQVGKRASGLNPKITMYSKKSL